MIVIAIDQRSPCCSAVACDRDALWAGAVGIYWKARVCALDSFRVAHRLAGVGGHNPYSGTGTSRGRRVAKESSDLPIDFIALGFKVDQASETLLSAQLLHVRCLSAG